MSSPPVIAVVDDDEAMRDALSELLHLMSMECRTFERAEAFIAASSQECFDCLITDLRMPGMSGMELIRELKALGSRLPVIVITSSMEVESRSEAIAGGAFAYLTKPVGEELLTRTLNEALAR